MLNITGEREWTIKAGKWFVNELIVLHGKLTIEPGADLIFGEQGRILINGSFHCVGDKKQSIKFSPNGKTWGGLYVFGDKESAYVTIKNTIFKDTDFFKHGVLYLTGGVNIYRATTSISDTFFNGTIAEDALNIIESDYELKNVTLSNTRSDAFDSDYSNGKIIDLDRYKCWWRRIGLFGWDNRDCECINFRGK